MANADGSVIIDTKMETEGVKKGTEKAKEYFEDFGEQAEKTGRQTEETGEQASGLASNFKKLGKVIAAAGVIDVLVDFGKEAIELGSDLEEVQNVVDVTFETMSDSVNKFAKDAQKSAGLSEKMAKQYVGTFGAMADSFGFTEQEAYEMSTALTQLTGDVASFYNLSQDEAATKLKGVFTGETEALKELGVVMTQTALDSYAMANGFGKTTSAMTEQEKVALRYQFVMDQLAGASGDFVRTQDSWANQSKILALQWESLMATLGSGLIDVLSPGIQFLNEKVLPALQTVAEHFEEAWDATPAEDLNKSIKNTGKTINKAKKQFEESAEEVERNAIAAEYYRDRLYELESAGLNTAEAQAAYAGVVANLNELYPELNLQINEQTGLLDDNSRAQLANIDAMKQKYFLLAVEEEANALYAQQAEIRKSVAIATQELEFVTGNLNTAETQLTETTSMSVEEMISLYNATELSAGVISNIDGSVVALTADQMNLVSEIITYRQQQETLNERLEESTDAVANLDVEIEKLYKDYGIAVDEGEDLADNQADISKEVDKTNSELEQLQTEYAEANEAARSSIDSQIGLFDELTVKSDKSADDIVKNWDSQRVAFENYSANLQKAVDMGLDEVLVKQLSDGSVESMAILDELVNNTDVDVGKINEAFQKTEKAKETVAATMADIQTDMSKKLGELEKSVSDSWGDQSSIVKREIRNMQTYINSLKGKTVNVTINQTTRKSTVGGGAVANTPVSYALNTASVPYLAKGAVIPPNAPFMAVLGDQKNGTNIEAPLSTIQEAVAAVMGDQVSAMMAGFEALLAENQRLRQVVENIEMGDTTIGQAANRYQQKMAIMRGG